MPPRAFSLPDYPAGRLALVAAVAGIAVTLGLRLDPMENPDSLAFLALARSMLDGLGIRYQEPLIPGVDLFAFRAPGYPVFVAAGMALGGIGVVIAIQGALNGLSAVLVGGIARDLHSNRAGWIAFALRAIWPFSWIYSGHLMSETLYEFLCVLAAWLAVRGVVQRRIQWSALAGCVAAGAVLCRPVGLALVGALGLWLLTRFPRAAAAFALAALVAWAPWPIRNALVLRAFVPFTTNGAGTAWIGLSGGVARPAYDWMGAHTELGELGFDRHFRQLNREIVKRDPGALVSGVAVRSFFYLGPIKGRATMLWVHRFAMLGALAALFLPGARAMLLLPGLVWGAQGALLVAILLNDRYRFPTDWCVVLAAAFGLTALAARIGDRRALLYAGIAAALSIAGSYALTLR